MDTKYGIIIGGDHCSIPWLVRHAAATISRFTVGKDGRTVYQRLKGNSFNKEVVEFGECVWYLKPKSVGKHSATDGKKGVWSGIMDESSGAIIGTSLGVIKVRDV